MTWTKVVKTITMLFAAVAIIVSFVGAVIAGSEIEGFEGFLAFIGILLAGVLVTAVFMPLIMMFVEVAESIFSIERRLKNIDYKSDTKQEPKAAVRSTADNNSDKKFCRNCGLEVSENDDYCPACGYHIKNNVLEHKVVEELNKNMKDKIPNENEHKCPNCGNVQNKSINRCLKCGQMISMKTYLDNATK